MRAVHAVVPAGVDDPRRPSGGNSYDRQVLRGLAARGWEVHERSVTGPWPEADPAAQGRLAGVLDDIGDGAVVLVDGLVASLSDRALVAAARRLRVVPLVHLPVGPDPREGRVLDAAAVVVATSRHTREWLLEHYALEPHRVGVAAPGTGAAPLGSGSVGGGSVGGGRLLSVGAVTPVKGHDVLVEALALLGEVSWTCRIVGSLEVDPAHAATVTAAYVQQGMAPRFTWTGALPRRAMTGEYAAADLVVVPSRHESYGMVAAEALAAGVPVVASDVGGLREALSTGPDACLFVPPDEPEALAAALCAWLTDPPLRQRMRAAARAARVKRRDWGRTVADLEELLLAAGGPVMSRRGLVQAGAALVILGALLVRLGPEPFVAAVRSVGPGALLLATVVTAGTTVCAAWRWRLVSTALGLPLTLGAAVGRSWRAQFLNVALPGGVLGDVHRGVSHGRDGGAPAAGVRAVVWERSLGQLVAVGLTVLALTAGRAFALVGVTVIAGFAVVAALVLLLRVVPERWRAVLLDDLRRLWVGHRLVPVVVTSTLAALGHAAVFLLAVRLTSPELPLLPLLPVALLVLVAAALPVNLAGWGPREGAAAWAFAAAGLPAAAGLEASVAFGVLSLVATWPGAVLLLAGRRTPAARGGTSVPPIPSSPEEMSRA